MGDVRTHAPFPPSASHRWLVCAQSHKPPVPIQEDSAASIEGVDAHWVGEQCLQTWTTDIRTSFADVTDAEHFIGKKLPSGKKTTKVMAYHVQKYVDYVRAHFIANGGQLFVEQRVDMPKIDQRFWGSADVIQITKLGRIHVFDLKYGLWVVEVDNNTQLMSYAIGALATYKHLVDLNAPVTVHICQPRVKHKDGPNRSVKFELGQLIQLGARARVAIKLAYTPNPPYVEGEHCQFCPKELICPKLNQFGRKAWI